MGVAEFKKLIRKDFAVIYQGDYKKLLRNKKSIDFSLFWQSIYRILEDQNIENKSMPYVTTRVIQTFLLDDKMVMKQRMRGFRLPFGTRAVNKDGVKTEGGEDLSAEMTLKRKFGGKYQLLTPMDQSSMEFSQQ